MLLEINPNNPQENKIHEVVNVLKKGGVIIYPTDTVYGLGCDITQTKAIERICRIKGIKPEKAQFSFICSDLSHLSDYVKPIDTATYRILKKVLPGPFTFIFNASNKVPKWVNSPKKTVGIRIPENEITLALVRGLGNPLLSTSLPEDFQQIENNTDPELMEEIYAKRVDLVIDGGYGEFIPSTIVDFTGDIPLVIRKGKGEFEEFL
jgi:tRNA threonylcarbamoyl adenosine modification protein (Sua5/YciO/YrdC/YwlC family)